MDIIFVVIFGATFWLYMMYELFLAPTVFDNLPSLTSDKNSEDYKEE